MTLSWKTILLKIFLFIWKPCSSDYQFQPDDFPNATFPEGFLFGTATSAFQSEGAWDVEGKGLSVLDVRFNGEVPLASDNTTARMAANGYYRYKEDISYVREAGFKTYRFSIQWPRILPSGVSSHINQKGVAHYMDIIDECLNNGIIPMVTMFHWELPIHLENIGGFLNPSIVEYFTDYAEILFTLFGDKVKWWITINEPLEITRNYRKTSSLSQSISPTYSQLLTGYYILKTHASVYRLYERKFKSSQKGKIAMCVGGKFGVPKSNSEEDKNAAERYNQFTVGWFSHPIFSPEGDYPPLMKSTLDFLDSQGNSNVDLLPRFSREEIQFIKGTADFFGVTYYTGVQCSSLDENQTDSFVITEANITESTPPEWPPTGSPWIKIYPEGMRIFLRWLKREYSNYPIYILENGCPSLDVVEDKVKLVYLKQHLEQIGGAINEDKCNIIGYNLWSIIDNFEFDFGYTYRFGLYGVDISDPARQRYKRKSAYYLNNLLQRIYPNQ